MNFYENNFVKRREELKLCVRKWEIMSKKK